MLTLTGTTTVIATMAVLAVFTAWLGVRRRALRRAGDQREDQLHQPLTPPEGRLGGIGRRPMRFPVIEPRAARRVVAIAASAGEVDAIREVVALPADRGLPLRRDLCRSGHAVDEQQAADEDR